MAGVLLEAVAVAVHREDADVIHISQAFSGARWLEKRHVAAHLRRGQSTDAGITCCLHDAGTSARRAS